MEPDVPSNLPGWLYGAASALAAAIAFLFRLVHVGAARRAEVAEAKVLDLQGRLDALQVMRDRERGELITALQAALADQERSADELRRSRRKT